MAGRRVAYQLLTVGLLFLSSSSAGNAQVTTNQPIVIAHRGASGYLPEHTLAAKALAFGMGADFLEQDVVLTRDDHPIVLHDIHLDTVSDVAEKFPGRHREDGRFYALDFTLAEIRQLSVHERVDQGTGQPVFGGRFPLDQGTFSLPSLTEELGFIAGLNKSSGRQAGIYVEVKSPAWHRAQGHDISKIVLGTLRDFGYEQREDRAYVQCFDRDELQRIRGELGCRLKLIQLIGENDWFTEEVDHDQLRTRDGLAELAEFADGIGPRIEHLYRAEGGRIADSGLVATAHDLGLQVHPFTHRSDALPAPFSSSAQLFEFLFREVKVDGLFSDFPDQVVSFLR